jgi:hypothetical protein
LFTLAVLTQTSNEYEHIISIQWRDIQTNVSMPELIYYITIQGFSFMEKRLGYLYMTKIET